jgi:phage/plasmid-associated DNA primase
MIQYPGIKMKWAVVLVSVVEGVGKGLLARLCSRVLGADNVNENANYKHLTNTHNTLLIGTQLLVLNEVSLGDFKSKQEGTNTLKNFVADDVYSCNFKNKPMVKAAKPNKLYDHSLMMKELLELHKEEEDIFSVI